MTPTRPVNWPSIASRLGLVAGAIALALSPGHAYWEMKLHAPQYPQGLQVEGYPDRIGGDVREIDGLNHYIGMRPLEQAAQWERQYGVYAIYGMVALMALAAVYSTRWTNLLLVAVVLFPAGFLADLYYWLRDFGLNLDPEAPLNRSIKPFVPTILGTGKVGQFRTEAWLGPGMKLALLASLAVLVRYWVCWQSAAERRRANATTKRSESSHTPVLVYVIALLGMVGLSTSAPAANWEVRPNTPLAGLSAAIQLAQDGDTITVHGGTYRGPIVIDKRLHLIGRDWPVIDGGGRGTVVTLNAAGSHFEGFHVRASGILLANEDGDSGILATAPDITIANNRIDDVLFGISVRDAARTVVRGNVLRGKDLDIARRGDLIRLWWSHSVTVESNIMTDGRDLVLWYSKDLTVRRNTVHRGRYGIHFMYCDNARVEDNDFADNSVGAFLMYSQRVTLERNWVTNNRGASGYGIGLKDMESYTVRGNVIAGNRVGLFFENANGLCDNNLLAFNERGAVIFTSCARNQIHDNSFIENAEQVVVEGNTVLPPGNVWQRNFWSDYRGLDGDGDGFGEHPYRPVRLFERLTDRNSALKLFGDGPAAEAIDYSSRLFPIFEPTPKFVDTQPRMAALPPPLTRHAPPATTPWVLVAVGFVTLGAAGMGRWTRVLPETAAMTRGTTPPHSCDTAIQVTDVTKRYGSVVAVNHLSFEVQPGEAVALWGPNGAGKSTLIKCLLGLIPFEGTATVFGRRCGLRGKECRRLIGYVPQEVKLHGDPTVSECVRFYARLRRVPWSRAQELLAEWGLAGVPDRAVRDLSGGMRQKLSLVLALLPDPPVLLLDEPTSNLDVASREEFSRLLLRLKAAGKTLLFCTHRTGEILNLADRVIVLQAGKKVEEGEARELWHRLLRPAVLRLTVRNEHKAHAIEVLRSSGYGVRTEGGELWVDVPTGRKAEALARLYEAGLPVIDFDVESDRGD